MMNRDIERLFICRPGEPNDKIIRARLNQFNEYVSLILGSMLERYKNHNCYISRDLKGIDYLRVLFFY